MKTRYGLLFSLTLLAFTARGQGDTNEASLSSVNVSHVYNPDAPILLDARVAVKADEEATVFLRVVNRPQRVTPALRYEVRAGYQDAVLDSGQLTTEQLVKEEGNQYYFRFTLPLTEQSHYLFMYARAADNPAAQVYRFDVALNTEQNFPRTDLLLMRPDEDLPIFQNYLPVATPFRIVSYYGSDSVAYAYYYRHEFEPNPPPMASGSGDVQRSLEIDSLSAIPLNETLSLEEQGLYFTQLDTASLYGISFRLEDQYYPRPARIETVVPPLRYISTSDEMASLQGAENPKQNLDEYWVKMTRSQERAKTIIRDYFRQVTRGNRLFTSYKEGWKTGRGMIYVLYGPPDAVYRDDRQEVWTYDEDRNLVDLSFTFAKVKNIFTPYYYNLVRDEDYQRFWFRNVDLWRKGRKEF